ncbi:hypothetical protein Rcae01_06746 [Novipirellula caenicola]|uniref:Uncharacterized protein n=1 Tax=Novipirellula caenicola TaxID=1536901 RepID=A0ABP9W1G9_9BACT
MSCAEGKVSVLKREVAGPRIDRSTGGDYIHRQSVDVVSGSVFKTIDNEGCRRAWNDDERIRRCTSSRESTINRRSICSRDVATQGCCRTRIVLANEDIQLITSIDNGSRRNRYISLGIQDHITRCRVRVQCRGRANRNVVARDCFDFSSRTAKRRIDLNVRRIRLQVDIALGIKVTAGEYVQ